MIDAPVDVVWEELADLGSHSEWMQDAVSIEFTSERTTGVGTTFDCETRIGPFKLMDRMEVTSWRPRKEIGVRHVGLVTGTGVFTLHPHRQRRRGRRANAATRVTWTERLYFPWWMGGPIGAFVARPVLRHVWKGNLSNLTDRIGPDAG